MRFSVHHLTRFEFDQPSGHSIHDVRLTPMPASGQRVAVLAHRRAGQALGLESTATATRSRPSRWRRRTTSVEIEVHGLYEYSGADQWLRYAETPTLPPPFWLRNTGMARHDESFDPLIEGLAERAAEPTQRVMVLHELMKRVGERIAYKTGVSTVDTTATEALQRGAGVAQDAAHVFIAACRRLGVPARYVSGYLRNDDPELHVGRTSHSWAEAWVPGLDWVGFDPTNDISPRGDSLGRGRSRLSRRRAGERPARRPASYVEPMRVAWPAGIIGRRARLRACAWSARRDRPP